MTFFLKLRHWELFLMLALPTIMSLMFDLPFKPLIAASIGLFLMLVLFGWMFSIASWCNSHLTDSSRNSQIVFGIGLALPIIYVLMYIFLYIPELEQGGPSRPPLWLLPMHMFSLAGIFYGFWYTARQVKELLEKQDDNFLIFSNTFFLLFIFPIGIWLIQPAINQLYFKLEETPRDSDEA